MMADCDSPLGFDELVDYWAGELSPEQEERVEGHYFACEHCARRLRQVEALERAVAGLVERGGTRASVTADVLERIAQRGVRLRRYALAPGQTVQCTAAPDDDFVVIELTAPQAEHGGGGRVDVLVEDLANARSSQRSLLCCFDAAHHSASLLFPAEMVRGYPRSRWTLSLAVGEQRSGAGKYVLDHTPWHELPPEQRG